MRTQSPGFRWCWTAVAGDGSAAFTCPCSAESEEERLARRGRDDNGGSFGAVVGLYIAVMLAFALLVSLCVLCYLISTTAPRGLDNVLELQATGSTLSPQRPGPSPLSAPAGPQDLKKPFLRGKVDCDNQPQDPERLVQPCFVATETSINVESPA